ncbi:ABC transporter permease [Fulvivirga sediminis]|uniref:ABC transporter permease n=1 Tax=Fulvivirga sediminis TaxID=2803949 RepID=A0A937FAM0_9BACT|nr:ABC transporter permease [Fulvivirga sediminis]MBL3657360.1 ABC transporter permease [Fulvivirga sediminis]
MFTNFLILAWRNIKKQKWFAVINILGLATGLSATFLILLFMADEWQANNWFKHAENHYMLESEWSAGVSRPEFTTLAPLGKELKEQYPQLVANYFTIDAVSCNVSDGEKKNFRLNLQIADGNMLTMFGIPLVTGNPQTAMDDPDGLVLQHDVALKFFGSTDILGKTLILETQNENNNSRGFKEYRISGVIDQIPENSLTDNLGDRVDIYVNSANAIYFRSEDVFQSWGNYILQTRLELQPGVYPKDLEVPLHELISANAPDFLVKDLTAKLTPLKSYNLIQNEEAKQRLLLVLGLVALFILLMAMINFVNISIGIANRRMKEIGVRKAIGSNRKELIWQFLLESTLLSVLAFALAMSLIQLVIPYYAQLLQKTGFSNISFWPLTLIMGSIAIITGILSGLYPALILSKLHVVKALKGKVIVRHNAFDIKKVLLVAQFSLALFFILSTLTISSQMDYLLNKDLGYDNSNVLVVSSVPRWYGPSGVSKMLSMKHEFNEIPGVQQVSLSYEIPDGRFGMEQSVKPSSANEDSYELFGQIICDSEYQDVYEFEMAEGRFFNDSDKALNKVVINETAAKSLFGDKPAVGEMIDERVMKQREIIGVVKDFHFSSLHENMRGLYFTPVDSAEIFRFLSFKLNGNTKDVTAAIEAKWRQVFPLVPFESFFLEDKLTELYADDTQFKKAFSTASIFAILIVLVGVFGVTMQNFAYRIKEIGIRKVLGASALNIWKLLGKELLSVYSIAAFMGVMAAYMMMNQWLKGFAYKIAQPYILYTFGIIGFLLIIMFTVSIELIKVIRINPVDSLKSE